MPKYHVGIREVYVSTREVEADSKEEALEKAGGSNEVIHEYSHALNKDYWTVEEVPNQ